MAAENTVFEQRRGPFTISTDKARLNVDLICDYLSETSYWARGRSHAAILRSIEHSLCFGLYDDGCQIGFSRVVTDYATFAWLADVFVLASHCGQGLGKWLIANVVGHAELQDVGLFVLATRDAHGLYRRYGGFEVIPEDGKYMARPGAARAS
ncbi:GNAT family N-acetyltransferase [Chloroflexota bacterium]